jgi:hypothetical protein
VVVAVIDAHFLLAAWEDVCPNLVADFVGEGEEAALWLRDYDSSMN